MRFTGLYALAAIACCILLVTSCQSQNTVTPTILPTFTRTLMPTGTLGSTQTPTIQFTPTDTPIVTPTPTPFKNQDGATPISTQEPRDIDFQPPPTFADIAKRYPELQSLLSHPEIDAVYKEYVIKCYQEGQEAATEFAETRDILAFEHYIRAELSLDTMDNHSTLEDLEALGIRISSESEDHVELLIPVALINCVSTLDDPGGIFVSIAELDHVTRVGQIELVLPERFSGSVDGEGVVVTAADAWQRAGYTGQGVCVGIIDPGFSGYRGLLETELPSSVTVQSFGYGGVDGGGEVHGAACAEIIHDMAPDAELFLAQANTLNSVSAATDWLIDQDVDIISHSAGFFSAPMDGSGPIAEIANRAAANGILWVNAAGNYADQHYRSETADIDADQWVDFSFGGELLGFSVLRSRTSYVTIVLNWNDWSARNQDYDLYIMDSNLNIVASATEWQVWPRWPTEYLRIRLPVGRTFYVAVYATSANRETELDIYFRYVSLSHFTPEHSLVSPADADGALAAGATYWWDDTLTEYSSQGPTNDGRLKPEISAPTSVSNATYGSFGGTSASAPHVAGAAALVLSAFPDLDREELLGYLTANALDLGSAGPDTQFGYGRVQLPPLAISGLPTPPPAAPPQPAPTPGASAPSTAMKFPYIESMSGSISDHGAVSEIIYPGDAELPYDYQGFIAFDIHKLPTDASVIYAGIELDECRVRGNPFAGPPGGLGTLSIWVIQYDALTIEIYGASPARFITEIGGCPSGLLDVTDAVRGHIGQGYFQMQLTFPTTSDDGEIDDIILVDPALLVVFSRP